MTENHVTISTILSPFPFFVSTTYPIATDVETRVIVDRFMLGLVTGSLKCLSLHEGPTTNDQQPALFVAMVDL